MSKTPMFSLQYVTQQIRIQLIRDEKVKRHEFNIEIISNFASFIIL